ADFELGVDSLVLDAALWGDVALTRAQVLNQFASVQDGDLIFDFGGGDILMVRDIDIASDLTGDLVIG
ncbi:unnamed protein product, partial [Ectocarpus sp. 12 AP-2014]